jgi:ABC-2 type transport system permease protein
MSLTIWSVIFQGQGSVFGYDQSQMITYIFIIGILQSLILASILHGLAQQIYSGDLSYELLKPVNIYVYLGIQDLADKLKNFGFVVIESMILFLIFQPILTLPSLFNSALFILWLVGGVILNFLITLLFGSFGFWSPETWGPRFLFFMFLDFTAGRLFPLDILPELAQKVLFFTPFPYLSFVQTQLFLEKLDPNQLFSYSLGLCLWIGITSILVKTIWQRGLKDYAAAGR